MLLPSRADACGLEGDRCRANTHFQALAFESALLRFAAVGEDNGITIIFKPSPSRANCYGTAGSSGKALPPVFKPSPPRADCYWSATPDVSCWRTNFHALSIESGSLLELKLARAEAKLEFASSRHREPIATVWV